MNTLLTVWEEKERAGRRANETTRWRNLRLEAEDIHTSAERLDKLARNVFKSYDTWNSGILDAHHYRRETGVREWQAALLAEAIAVHPNTPRLLLANLLTLTSPFEISRAICQNILLSEMNLREPDFWERFNNDEWICDNLLSQESLPVQVATALKNISKAKIAQAATYHVALNGQVKNTNEGFREITHFWREECKEVMTADVQERTRIIVTFKMIEGVEVWCEQKLALNHFEIDRNPHKELTRIVELGLAPAWSLEDENNAIFTYPQLTFYAARYQAREFLRALKWKKWWQHTAYARFVVALHGELDLEIAYDLSCDSFYWTDKLALAIGLPLTDKPFPDDLWKRSPNDLMHHLARNGNRLVRWVAQSRLSNPRFIFRWKENESGIRRRLPQK